MLETRKVFIDTQSFVKAGLHFDGAAFRSFRKYCEAKELFHLSTSVVEAEVKSKIEGSVKEAIAARQTFRRKARLLSTLDDDKTKKLFEEIPDEVFYRLAEDVFDDFMSACATDVLKADRVNADELLSLYFGRKPPFGEGKKKSEFPDAISILSLKSYLQEDEKIYIVSGDGDLKSLCDDHPRFIHIETLDKLLDIYTTHTSARHEQVKQYFVDNENAIQQKITEFLEGCDVYNSSTWEDAEVDDGLSVLSLGHIEPSVVYIDDEGSQVTFDIDVVFQVTVTGPDFINGIYDREEGRVFTFDSTSVTSEISRTFTVELYLYYEFKEGVLSNAEAADVFIAEASRGIEVDVEESEPDWH